MLNWFDKWFAKKCKEAWENSQYAEEADESPHIIKASKSFAIARSKRNSVLRDVEELGSEPITFKMFKANGGWAIEFRQYDVKNDRVDTSLYVVNNEEELGKHISQIITMEALKR